MIRKLKESKPVIALIWLVVLLVAGYALRTFVFSDRLIFNADRLINIISDSSADALANALPVLFWLPAMAYGMMYLMYVNAQHGVDPSAEMRKNGTAWIMLLVLLAAEFILGYVVLTSSMRVLTTDEMYYAQTVKGVLLKAYGIATAADVVLYLVPAFLGRPRC